MESFLFIRRFLIQSRGFVDVTKVRLFFVCLCFACPACGTHSDPMKKDASELSTATNAIQETQSINVRKSRVSATAANQADGLKKSLHLNGMFEVADISNVPVELPLFFQIGRSGSSGGFEVYSNWAMPVSRDEKGVFQFEAEMDASNLKPAEYELRVNHGDDVLISKSVSVNQAGNIEIAE